MQSVVPDTTADSLCVAVASQAQLSKASSGVSILTCLSAAA